MIDDDRLLWIDTESRALAAIAAEDYDLPVPACPGWSMAELLAHAGGAHRWAVQVVAEANQDRHERVLPDPPADPALLADWYVDGLEQLEAVLAEHSPQDQAWTPVGKDQQSWWWRRKIAVETSLHRWDGAAARAAAGGPAPQPIPTGLAVDGIDEFLDDFLVGLVRRAGPERPRGSIRLHPVDADARWWFDLGRADGDRVEVSRDELPADAVIRGTASDILLWLWNRLDDPAATLSVIGADAVLADWAHLTI